MKTKKACAAVGVSLLIVGMHGFAVAGFSGIPSPAARTPVELGVYPWQNALHLFLGWILVAAAAKGEAVARKSASWAGVSLLLLASVRAAAALGVVPDSLAFPPVASWVHGGLGLVLLHYGVRGRSDDYRAVRLTRL